MENQDRIEVLDESVDENMEHPNLLTKLRQAKEDYGVDGANPNPEMEAYVSGVIEKIERVRATEKRAKNIRRDKRRRAKKARKINRRR